MYDFIIIILYIVFKCLWVQFSYDWWSYDMILMWLMMPWDDLLIYIYMRLIWWYSCFTVMHLWVVGILRSYEPLWTNLRRGHIVGFLLHSRRASTETIVAGILAWWEKGNVRMSRCHLVVYSGQHQCQAEMYTLFSCFNT